tara:strand:+ start:757 stop:924 length:168 start_codon:yes stop_codon:yes gene_type:complete
MAYKRRIKDEEDRARLTRDQLTLIHEQERRDKQDKKERAKKLQERMKALVGPLYG